MKKKQIILKSIHNEIDTLRNQAENRDDKEELKKLDEINDFIMSIEKKYEIAQLTLSQQLIEMFYARKF